MNPWIIIFDILRLQLQSKIFWNFLPDTDYMSPFDYSEKQKENVPDDGGLDELAVIVRNMKKAAKEQNEEISAQIKTVDKLKAQTTHEISEMDKLKTRLKKVASWFD